MWAYRKKDNGPGRHVRLFDPLIRKRTLVRSNLGGSTNESYVRPL